MLSLAVTWPVVEKSQLSTQNGPRPGIFSEIARLRHSAKTELPSDPEDTISAVKTDQNPAPKTHTTLSPRTNLLLIVVWAIVVVSAFVIVRPRLPFTVAIAGGLCGALAGIMQHLSIRHDPLGFLAASSLMGVRCALTNTAWGRRYIAWLYFSKFALVLVTFLLIRNSLPQVLFGYLTAYFSLMLIRDIITLRDTFALHSLRSSAPTAPA